MQSRWNFSFTQQIIIAFLLSVTLGVLAPVTGIYLSLLGDWYLNAIKFMVVPIILISIPATISSINDLKGSLLQIIGLFLLTAMCASIIGLVVGHIMPWQTLDMALPSAYEARREIPPFMDTLSGFIPNNIIAPMLKGQVISLIIIAITLGVALNQTQAPSLKKGLQEANQIVHTLVSWVIKFTPIGVIGVLTPAVAKLGLTVLMPLAMFIGAIYFACLLHIGFVYTSIIHFLSPFKITHVFRQLLPLQLSAAATCSSFACLPLTQQTAIDKIGAHPEKSKLATTLGSSMNMDACGGLYPAISAIAIAHWWGIPLSPSDYAMIAFTAVIASVGAAGVPGAALVFLTITLNSVGLPLEGIALVAAVDRLVDMARTATNVTGDVIVSAAISGSPETVSKQQSADTNDENSQPVAQG